MVTTLEFVSKIQEELKGISYAPLTVMTSVTGQRLVMVEYTPTVVPTSIADAVFVTSTTG